MMVYQVRLNLDEEVAKQGLTLTELSRRTAINGWKPIRPERLSVLMKNTWSEIRRWEIAVLCAVLNLQPSDLFQVYAQSLFYGPQVRGNLTVHVASSSFPDPLTCPGAPQSIDRSCISIWDLRAFELISNYAAELGIQTKLQIHLPTASDHKYSPVQLKQMFRDGSHVFLGSPLTSNLTEQVVACMHDATPFDSGKQDRFRYSFVWHQSRARSSSFGFPSPNGDLAPGIYDNRRGGLLIERSYSEFGGGTDCGLIITYREPVDRRFWPNKGTFTENTIVVLAGHGGPGTLAAAHILCDSENDDALYPKEQEEPLMRAVQAKVWRAQDRLSVSFDNRELNSFSLIPD
jgi:DNA-binding Xre family transcriptional regulator